MKNTTNYDKFSIYVFESVIKEHSLQSLEKREEQ